MSALKPPRIVTEDPGAHDVSESSDEHFSSASEGDSASKRLSSELTPQSPLPITRVERVDDSPAHGEVPGTPAYKLRTQDAVPDEIEVIPEGRRPRSRAASTLSANSRPGTPGGSPIPKTVVDKVDDKPSHGEVDGTLAKEMRMADAAPDEVNVRVPTGGAAGSEGRQVEQDPEDRQAWFRSMWENKSEEQPEPSESADDENEQFGDEFDEFAEGGGDDDFGDFDEAEEDISTPVPETQPEQPPAFSVLDGLPPLDPTANLSGPALEQAIAPYLEAIFPGSTPFPSDIAPPDLSNSSSFLSDRSLALWQQLVQPPPMQPPNWTRSRIRRLFLVSLGVPVDLDEILPPSKQKRLVLPNINLGSPRASTSALERLKQADVNDSSTSIDSRTGAPKRVKRSNTKGPPPPPDFDTNAAAMLSGTTEEAIHGFSDEELKDHVFTLEILNQTASAVLEYWLQRKDEALKEKEALEGVIENLVGYVKGRRGK